VRGSARQLLDVGRAGSGVAALAGQGRNDGVVHRLWGPASGGPVASAAIPRTRLDVGSHASGFTLDAGAAYGVRAAMAANASRSKDRRVALHPLGEVACVVAVFASHPARQWYVPGRGHARRATCGRAARGVAANTRGRSYGAVVETRTSPFGEVGRGRGGVTGIAGGRGDDVVGRLAQTLARAARVRAVVARGAQRRADRPMVHRRYRLEGQVGLVAVVADNGARGDMLGATSLAPAVRTGVSVVVTRRARGSEERIVIHGRDRFEGDEVFMAGIAGNPG
jgi:hypothetical protein